MGRHVVNTFTDAAGKPASCHQVMIHATGRIRAASRHGRGVRLSACEARALDWAIIRIEGGIELDGWLESSCDEHLSSKEANPHG